MQPSIITITSLLGLGISITALAAPLPPKGTNKQDSGKKITQSARTGAFSAEEQLKGFKVPEGFIIELVASEKHGVVNPIDVSFDDAGRLWTQTGSMYPLDPVKDIPWNVLLKLMDNPAEQEKNPDFKRIKDLYQLKTKGQDKILVLDDPTKAADKPLTVWADGLSIPQSILPYKDGAYVCHGSELFFLRDTNNDGKSDTMEPVLTGLGFTDTHTMAHTLVRAPGSYIHFSQGALNKGQVTAVKSGNSARIDYSKISRFSLDGKELDLVNSGLNNIWGFQLRANGQWYLSEANDLGFSVTPAEPQTGFTGIGSAKLRPYQPLIPAIHPFRVGGTGISGLEFMEDTTGSFPANDWKDVALLANPITSTINAVKITRLPDGTVSGTHLEDFLTSEDDWFRPVNLEFGPDGCLYIADWYNKIISHNEVGTSHPDRDKTHGRIWRIRHESQKPREIPNLITTPTAELVEHLKSGTLWQTRAAWQQISDRPHAETIKLTPSLIKLATDKSQSITARIHALWSLESLKHFDKPTIISLLSDTDPDLVRETIRSLSNLKLKPSEVNELIATKATDPNPMIRSQVLRTLSEINVADQSTIHTLVAACKPALPGNALGGSYERNFERFLARKALEQYPSELVSFLKSPESNNIPVENKLWAIQVFPAAEKKAAFLSLWQSVSGKALDDETFIAIAEMLADKEIYTAVVPNFSDPKNALAYVKLAIKHQARVQSPQLTNALSLSVKNLISKPETLELSLEAVNKLNISGLHDIISKIAINPENQALTKLLLATYTLQPQHYTANLVQIINDVKHPRDTRLEALTAYIKPARAEASTILQEMIRITPPDQHQEITEKISQNKEACLLLLEFYNQKKLTPSAFSISASERIKNSAPNDPNATALHTTAANAKAEEQKLRSGKIQQYLAATKSLKGDAKAGEQTFQSCLMCHKVGTKGHAIAPALDGSANRDTAHLITAIVDPDQAVEGGYGLFRVNKKDGSSNEGFLVKQDEKGITTAVMGGATTFTPAAEIASSSFVGGRSFMPAMFGTLPDQQIVDLLEYIKTLK